jgi:DNA-binding MarR family transcriptional regulator
MSTKKSVDALDKEHLRRAWSGLVIEIFRANGDLLAAGDALVGDLGLTSARWQVLGAIALSPVPLPVAHIARNMGLTRQAVQRVVDEMRADGLVRLEQNPHHRRAMLVLATERGEAAYRAASERQERWAETLTAGLAPEGFEAASALLREMLRRLEATNPAAVADDRLQMHGA